VINRSRIVFTLAALAVASAAAATIRWQTWTSGTACLLCGARDTGESALMLPGGDRPSGGAGLEGSYARSSGATFTPGPLAPPLVSLENGSSRSSSARLASAPRGWQPWGSGSGAFRVAASGSSRPSTSLGGLWRLMSLSRPNHGSDSAVHGVPVHNIKPPTDRPVKTPKPGTNHSGQNGPGSSPTDGGSISEAPPTASTGGAPSTDPFHEHENAPGDPFQGPGGFNPGTPGGRAPSAPAATARFRRHPSRDRFS
jgi:hypothetical protein